MIVFTPRRNKGRIAGQYRLGAAFLGVLPPQLLEACEFAGYHRTSPPIPYTG